jgi:NitT/TauT family transport system substrate-binding protein
MRLKIAGLALAISLTASILASGPAQAEASKVRIAIQPGLAWLPFLLADESHLIEKHAKAAGLGDVAVEIRTVSGGGVMNDALLSGNLDFASSGIPAFMVIWDKAAAALPVKAVCGFGSLPFDLVTRDPKVKSIKDFTDANKIALPTVKASGQAIILEMAVAKEFGQENYAKLDPLTISRGHPDAVAALLSGKGEIDSHFSAPPYQQVELRAQGVHSVLNTGDVLGQPLSNGLLYTTQKFHDANPKLFKAVMDALKEADERINADKRAAAELYVRVTKDTSGVEQILEAISAPGVDYTIAPQSVYAMASFMNKVGTVKHPVASWKDLFFSEAHTLPGS